MSELNELTEEEKLLTFTIVEQARQFPAEDRQLLIKVLEDEQAFNYRLKSGAFVFDTEDEGEALDSYMELCAYPNKPAMCIVGAIVASKLAATTPACDVVYLSTTYASHNDIDTAELDHIIDAGAIPQFIEELRRLELDG